MARHTSAAPFVAAAAADELIDATTGTAATDPAPAMHSTHGDDESSTATADAAGVLASLSCEVGDFHTTVAAIRVHDSAARLRAFADACRQKEGVVRTPMVLLQLLALIRQFECLSPLVGTASVQATSDQFGRDLEAHGSFISCHCLHTAHGLVILAGLLRTDSFLPAAAFVLSSTRSLGVLRERSEASVARSPGVALLSSRAACLDGVRDAGQ